MLISARHLVDRMRHPRSRADELARLRSRFAAQPTPTTEQRALAIELRALREQMSAALAGVDGCGTCAKGHPLPSGRWDGGHCCSGDTFRVFTAEEVAALKAGGTRPSDLAPPRNDHAGCAFRGPIGCTLSPRDRPTICVRYLCTDLRAEVKDTPRWREIRRLGAALRDTFARFGATTQADIPGISLVDP